MAFLPRKSSDRQLLEEIHRCLIDTRQKVGQLMTTVQEVQEALTTLTTDLEADAAAALAEFAKLEAEIAEKAPEVDLAPLKEAVEGIDTKVKAAASSIPTE